MFRKNDFGEDGKRRVENKRENGQKGCLVGRGGEGRGKRKIVMPNVFSLGSLKLNLPRTQFLQNGKKIILKMRCKILDSNAHTHVDSVSFLFFWCHLFLLIFLVSFVLSFLVAIFFFISFGFFRSDSFLYFQETILGS